MDLTGHRHNPDLARASTIPARWYTDPAMLDAERQMVFGRTWQAVGHAAAVREAGSYLACDIAGEPVLITRSKDSQRSPMCAAIAALCWRKEADRLR